MRKTEYMSTRVLKDYAPHFAKKEQIKMDWENHFIELDRKITKASFALLFIAFIAHIFIK